MSTRFFRSVVTAAVVALSVAPPAHAGAPTGAARATGDTAALACPPVAHVGTYRLQLKRDGEEPLPVLLVLERSGGCLSALLVTDRGASTLQVLSVGDGSLTAGMRVASKQTTFTFRFGDETVSGEMERGTKVWSMTGQRTS